MTSQFSAILKHFRCQGRLVHLSSHHVGHIHDTYIATFEHKIGETQRYLLQRINHKVFRHPSHLMENIQRVTAHLRHKIIENSGDPTRETLTIIPTLGGKMYYKTPSNTYWRVYLYIEGAQTYETIQHVDHIYNIARAFGRFQRLLNDFPAKELHETIPNFHHTPKRYAAFLRALEKDPYNRAKDTKEDIEFVRRRVKDTPVLINLIKSEKLPIRVTHNDTKFNNVLIDDQTGKGLCVVDLDTVMPGLSLYDFGDAVRSGANLAIEGQENFSEGGIDLERFEGYVYGYLDATRNVLTPLEVSLLPFSAKLMTLECGIRFLTDYLQGDIYFKIDRPDHNLDRCRTQFTMVADMERKFDRMERIVDKYR